MGSRAQIEKLALAGWHHLDRQAAEQSVWAQMLEARCGHRRLEVLSFSVHRDYFIVFNAALLFCVCVCEYRF